jgi:hypothetical protein
MRLQDDASRNPSSRPLCPRARHTLIATPHPRVARISCIIHARTHTRARGPIASLHHLPARHTTRRRRSPPRSQAQDGPAAEPAARRRSRAASAPRPPARPPLPGRAPGRQQQDQQQHPAAGSTPATARGAGERCCGDLQQVISSAAAATDRDAAAARGPRRSIAFRHAPRAAPRAAGIAWARCQLSRRGAAGQCSWRREALTLAAPPAPAGTSARRRA